MIYAIHIPLIHSIQRFKDPEDATNEFRRLVNLGIPCTLTAQASCTACAGLFGVVCADCGRNDYRRR